MRRPNLIQITTVVLLCLGVVLIFGAIAWQGRAIDRLNLQLKDRDATIAELLEQYRALYEETEQQGVNPDAPSPDQVENKAQSTEGPQGVQGIPGRAPTSQEIRDAVEQFCAFNSCTGPQGFPGPAGSDGFGTNGKDGANGKDGVNGKDGADGAPGPAGPVGPSGPPGPTGERGEKGDTGETGATCPEGFQLTLQTIVSVENPLGVPAYICLGV